MKLNNYFVFLFLIIVSATAYAGEGEFRKTIIKTDNGSLIEKYDVFTEDNKEYIAVFNEAGKSRGKSISLTSKEKSGVIQISSTIGRGDGRYSKSRSGSFQFKFDKDDQVYKFSGNSYYLRSVYANISKTKNKEFLKKLASKNYVYIKVIVVGTEHTFKVNLKGSTERLNSGKFI